MALGFGGNPSGVDSEDRVGVTPAVVSRLSVVRSTREVIR
jgi:hypothetical protein